MVVLFVRKSLSRCTQSDSFLCCCCCACLFSLFFTFPHTEWESKSIAIGLKNKNALNSKKKSKNVQNDFFLHCSNFVFFTICGKARLTYVRPLVFSLFKAFHTVLILSYNMEFLHHFHQITKRQHRNLFRIQFLNPSYCVLICGKKRISSTHFSWHIYSKLVCKKRHLNCKTVDLKTSSGWKIIDYQPNTTFIRPF